MSTRNPGLTPHTFQDSGKVVLIRRVSPYLVFELQRAFPPPKPPKQEVDYGDNKKHVEENKAHPDYIEALQQYNVDFQEKLTRLMIKRGVEFEMTPDVLAEVADLRKFWEDEYGTQLDKDDKMVYVLNLCIGSDKDLEELLGVIMRRSQPTEPAITESLESFRSPV